MAIGYKSKYAEPKPTKDVETVEERFSMPNLTIVQMIFVALIIFVMFTLRKQKNVRNPLFVIFIMSIGLLHWYDHLYRIKRGPERLFFLPQVKEGYKCCGGM